MLAGDASVEKHIASIVAYNNRHQHLVLMSRVAFIQTLHAGAYRDSEVKVGLGADGKAVLADGEHKIVLRGVSSTVFPCTFAFACEER